MTQLRKRMLEELQRRDYSQSTAVLNGHVTDPQGNSLPQASVELIDRGPVLGRATSGSDKGTAQRAVVGLPKILG